MFQKSFLGKTVCLYFALVSVLSFIFFAPFTAEAAANTECIDAISFRVFSKSVKVESVPADATIEFNVILPEKCKASIEKVIAAQIINGSPSEIAVLDFRDTTSTSSYVNYTKRWAVSGLKYNDGSPVTAAGGGKMDFQAAILPKGGVYGKDFQFSKTVSVAVTGPGTKDVPVTPTKPGTPDTTTTPGQGSNTVSTPVVGTIDSPISIKSLGELVTTGIKYLLGFLATLSVLFIIIGGVRMVVSGGSEGEVKAGKQTVTWAVVGMVVSLLAFTIINVVQSLLKVK